MKRSFPVHDPPRSPGAKNSQNSMPKISSPLRNPPISPVLPKPLSPSKPFTPSKQVNRESLGAKSAISILKEDPQKNQYGTVPLKFYSLHNASSKKRHPALKMCLESSTPPKETPEQDRRKSTGRRVSFAPTVKLKKFVEEKKISKNEEKEHVSKKSDQVLVQSDDGIDRTQTDPPPINLSGIQGEPPPSSVPITPQPQLKEQRPSLTLSTPSGMQSNETADESHSSFEMPMKDDSRSSFIVEMEGAESGPLFTFTPTIGSSTSFKRNPRYEPLSAISPIDFHNFSIQSIEPTPLRTPQPSSFTKNVATPSHDSSSAYFNLTTPTPLMKQSNTVYTSATQFEDDKESLALAEKYLTAEVLNSDTEPEPSPTLPKPTPELEFPALPTEDIPGAPAGSQRSIVSATTLNKHSVSTSSPKKSSISTYTAPTQVLSQIKSGNSDSSIPQQLPNSFASYAPPLTSKIKEIRLDSESFSAPQTSPRRMSPQNQAFLPNKTSTSPILSEKTQRRSPILTPARNMSSPSIATMLRELNPMSHYTTPIRKGPSDTEEFEERKTVQTEIKNQNEHAATPPSFLEVPKPLVPLSVPSPSPQVKQPSQIQSPPPKVPTHSTPLAASIRSHSPPRSIVSPTPVVRGPIKQEYPRTSPANRTLYTEKTPSRVEEQRFGAPSVVSSVSYEVTPPSKTSFRAEPAMAPITPFKEPPTPNLADPSVFPTMKGTPLSVRRRTPVAEAATPSPLKYELQPPSTPLSDRIKRMFPGSLMKDPAPQQASPASSVSWMDDMDAADLKKEKMPFSQESEKDVFECPKSLHDLLSLADFRDPENLTIQHSPLNKTVQQNIVTAITTSLPLLQFRHSTCRQMMAWIKAYHKQNMKLLKSPVTPRVIRQFQEHTDNPFLQNYLVEQVKALVAKSRYTTAKSIQDWLNGEMRELKARFEEILREVKNDDALLSEKLNFLGTIHEIVEEKVEKDSEASRKEKAQHDDEAKRLTTAIHAMRARRDEALRKKAVLEEEYEAALREVEQRQKAEEELENEIKRMEQEKEEVEKETEAIQFYTVEDYRRFKSEYDIISKMTGWSFLLGSKRKGRESWLTYENLIGFSYLNTLKVYFEVKHGAWTLARTEAHDRSLPIIVEIVDMFPERLPPSEQELSKASRWMAHRWDFFSKLNFELYEGMPKYWLAFKYEHDTHKLRIIHKCFVSERFRVNVHLLLDIWKYSAFVTPQLEYEVQVIFGNVDSEKLFTAIRDAHELGDVREIFAANMKALDEAN